MVTIKRYPNRKLYNTDTKKYITLDGISDLIRDGVEVEVVDHATGEDLTALTLSQILFEREKKSVSGFLPHAVLTGLVKAGGETLASLRRTLASPLKLLSQVDEEINRRITLLVQRGAIDVDEAERWRDLLLGVDDEGNAAAMLSEEELQALFARHGVPRREDLERLESQLEALAKSLENLTA
jgi:polyhydroxyalkanoate synthesis repressor PhaR